MNQDFKDYFLRQIVVAAKIMLLDRSVVQVFDLGAEKETGMEYFCVILVGNKSTLEKVLSVQRKANYRKTE